MRRYVLGLVAIGMIVMGGVVVADTPPPNYTETFDGDPLAPLAFSDMQWDIQTNSTGNVSAPEAHPAKHGPDCSAPPATHMVSTYADSVFVCKDHVMTSMGDGGYGLIYLTPNVLADMAPETVIRFDVSSERLSTRDWWDVWVTPFADNSTTPLEDWLPALHGEPKNAVSIRLDNGFNGSDKWRMNVVRNFQSDEVGVLEFAPTLPRSAIRRDTYELRLSRTGMTFCAVAEGQCRSATFADLGWSQGIVQIGHHSYSPDKDGAGDPQNTYHWDNVSISPSVPFTMVQTNRTMVTDSSVITLNAPANGFLRFHAVGTVDVSTDGGPWVRAQRQSTGGTGGPEHAYSYWHPIAAGTQSFRLRFSADQYMTFGWYAKGFSVWSLSGAPGPTSTPANTATSTNTPLPTNTPAPTNTPTVTPTPAPATPTATATPRTYRCQVRNANGSWTTVWSRPGGGSCP